MSSPLIDWTAAQLSALYSPKHTAPNESPKLDLDLSAFAPDAEIRLNHAKVELKKEFLAFVESRRSVTAGVECQMDDVVETAVEEGNDAAGKIVAGKATLVRTHPFLMRAAPMKTQTILIFSAKIQESGGQRQIVELFQTAVDKPVQIKLQTPRVDASEL